MFLSSLFNNAKSITNSVCISLEKILYYDTYLSIRFKSNSFVLFAIFSLYIFTAFSPILSWFLGIILLIFFSRVLDNYQRVLISFNIIASGSLIIASRRFFAPGASDDFVSYYQFFQVMQTGSLSANLSGDWDDIGIKLLFYIYFKLFGNVSPSALLFLVSSSIGTLFYLWIELFGMRMIKKESAGITIASSFIFFSYFHATQLIPQMFSMVIVLYALFSKNIFVQILLIPVMSLFHIIGPVIFGLSYAVVKMPKFAMPLILFIALIFVGFTEEIRAFVLRNNISFDVIHRIVFHMEYTKESFCLPDLQPIRYFVALLVMYTYKLFCDKRDKSALSWNSFILLFVFLYFVLMPLCLAPLRGTLLLNSLLIGFALYKGFERIENVYSYLLVYVVVGKFAYYVKKIPGDFQVFYTYDWYSFQPFYYWN